MSGSPRGKKRTPRRKLAECIFHKGFVTEQVDPVVDRIWKARFHAKTPFGDLRNMWRRHHCRTLNPYGDSENCPYTEQQCARAFFDAVRTVTRVGDVKVPVGYFIRVAKSEGARRADDAVGLRAAAARTRLTRTDVPFIAANAAPILGDQAAPSATPRADHGAVGSTARDGDPARRGGAGPLRPGERAAADLGAGSTPGSDQRPSRNLPGSGHGPVALGDLFGSLAIGPRAGSERSDEGEKGA